MSDQRVHLPRLDLGKLGIRDLAGWWTNCELPSGNIEILFRCANNRNAGIANHSIDSNGEVNASVLCHCGCGYHEFVVLDNWPKKWSKAAGEKYVTIRKDNE